MKVIECRGSSLEMGRQYGEQAREEIRFNHELHKSSWNPDIQDAFTANAKRVLRKMLPEVFEELTGIAEGAGVELTYVLLSNQVDTYGELVERCTPVILRSTPEGPIIAKNNDPPETDYTRYIVRKCYPDKGIPFIHIPCAGWLNGFDMMNAEGLACTHGSVGSVFDKSGERVDIRLYSYQLARHCNTTEEFTRQIQLMPLTGKGFSVAVGDIHGETATLDAAVPHVAVRDRNKQFDYSTNVYMAPGLENADMRRPDARKICIYRYGYLEWIARTAPPENLEDMKKLLSSHEPWAPCRHGGAHDAVTNWSLICLPQQGEILLSHGHPCENEYKEYSL